MKKLLIFLIVPFIISTGCTSKNKSDTDNNSINPEYKEQPQDHTQVNDTSKIQSPDSMVHRDTMP